MRHIILALWLAMMGMVWVWAMARGYTADEANLFALLGCVGTIVGIAWASTARRKP